MTRWCQTISCEAINHDHDLDMQQVWAEDDELAAVVEASRRTHEPK